jgi:hypothetical protein
MIELIQQLRRNDASAIELEAADIIVWLDRERDSQIDEVAELRKIIASYCGLDTAMECDKQTISECIKWYQGDSMNNKLTSVFHDTEAETPICSACGGGNVHVGGTLYFDKGGRRWVPENTNDVVSWCDDCGAEKCLSWVARDSVVEEQNHV